MSILSKPKSRYKENNTSTMKIKITLIAILSLSAQVLLAQKSMPIIKATSKK